MKIRKIVLGVVMGLLVGGAAFGDLSFSDLGAAGNIASPAVELGATKTVDVIYTAASPVVIDAYRIVIDYDPAQMTVNSATDLTGIGVSSDPAQRTGSVVLGRVTTAIGQTTIPLAAGQSITLARISFTVAQTDANAGNTLKWVWATDYSAGTNPSSFVVQDGNYITGNTSNKTFIIGASAKPTPPTAGLTVSDPGTGNLLNINWNDDASDVATQDNIEYTTYFGAGTKCRYTLLGDTAADPATTLLSQGDATTYNHSASVVDGIPYYYKIKALDNCAPTGNASDFSSIVSAVSHDLTPPTAPTVTTTSGDGLLTVGWGGGGNDVGGYIIFRKDGDVATNDNPGLSLLPAANVNKGETGFNGTDPSSIVSLTPEQLNGWTVVGAKTSSGSEQITGLTNGAKYNFLALAYDPATSTQQGYNWSPYSALTPGIPGVAPGAISNFIALAGPTTGAITFRWVNPTAGGGARIVYTDNIENWGSLTEASPLAIDVFAPLTGETISSFADGTALLEVSKVYYFKAFAFNQTTEELARKYSITGAASATWPGLVGSSTTTISGGYTKFTYKLKKSETGKLIINTIALPGTTLIQPAEATITKASALAAMINQVAGSAVVLAISRWDPTEARARGYVPIYGDNGAITSLTGEDFDLSAGGGYQIFVNKDVEVTFEGK